MKKFLPYILILVVLIGLFSPAISMNAQATGNCFILGPIINNQTECESKGGAWQAPGAPVPSTGGGWIKWFMDILGNIAYNTVLKFAALILWIAGTILNFVLDFTIVNMSKNISGLTGINIAWKALRDLMNIAFVFLLVYEGIKMIIGQGDSGKIKQFITWIVLASLLINFSLFFTKVMIDASNIVTIGIYNSILDNGDKVLGVDPNTGREAVSGLSVPFMSALGMSDWYSNASFKALNDNTGAGDYNVLIFAIAGTVLFIIVAFVFFAVACIFTIRYITLLVLLMLSPVAYMGAALPFMKSYADEWWESFKSQLFFAPIYMLMTWVILTLMSSPNFLIKGNWGELITNQVVPGQGASGGQGSIGLLFNFVVIIGLVIFSLITAKSTASKGSKLIGQATGNLTKFAGGALLGGGGWLGRKSFGLVGNAVSNNAKLQENASKKTGIAGAWARSKLYVGKTARDATFDIRNASVPTNVLGDIVEGTVGRTTYGKKFGLNDVNIPSIAVGAPMAGLTGVGTGGTKGYKEEKEESDKRVRDRDAANATELELAQAKRDVVAGANATGANDPVGSPEHTAYTDAIDKMEKALAKLTDKETEALVAGNRELLDKQEFANRISVKQLEALNKSDQLSEGEKTRLKNKRFEGVRAIYDTAALAAHAAASAIPVAARTDAQKAAIELVDNAPKRIKGLSDSEIEMMDPTSLTKSEFISELRSAQFESIAKSSKFTSSQKKTIKDTRLSPLLDALDTSRTTPAGVSTYAPNPALVKSMITKGLSRKDVAGLMDTKATFTDHTGAIVTASILTHPEVLEQYTPNMLKLMGQEMNSGNIQTLRDVIEDAGTTPGSSAQLTNLATWLTSTDGVNNFS